MNFDDILITGDSFCVHRTRDTDWPRLLVKSLTGSFYPVRGKGFSGTSWWSTRNNLIKELQIKVPKILIICHTEANRLPSDFDFGLNLMSVERGSIEIPKEHANNFDHEMLNAAKSYYKYLLSTKFFHWAQHSWFNELDDIIELHGIKRVIHLHCFGPYYKDTELHTFKTGITSKEVLWDLANGVDQSQARNHLTEQQNIDLAQSLYNTLENYPLNTVPRNLNLLKK